eukprot:Gb_12565 [translate_table: standard]
MRDGHGQYRLSVGPVKSTWTDVLVYFKLTPKRSCLCQYSTDMEKSIKALDTRMAQHLPQLNLSNDLEGHHLPISDANSSLEDGSCIITPQTGGSRWNPTADQVAILKELYRGGMRTPTAEQIQHISSQLRLYGKIEGKNVFYWFQNHKARERQKRRRCTISMLHKPSHDSEYSWNIAEEEASSPLPGTHYAAPVYANTAWDTLNDKLQEQSYIAGPSLEMENMHRYNKHSISRCLVQELDHYPHVLDNCEYFGSGAIVNHGSTNSAMIINNPCRTQEEHNHLETLQLFPIEREGSLKSEQEYCGSYRERDHNRSSESNNCRNVFGNDRHNAKDPLDLCLYSCGNEDNNNNY